VHLEADKLKGDFYLKTIFFNGGHFGGKEGWPTLFLTSMDNTALAEIKHRRRILPVKAITKEQTQSPLSQHDFTLSLYLV
jgi:hypothetical protein